MPHRDRGLGLVGEREELAGQPFEVVSQPGLDAVPGDEEEATVPAGRIDRAADRELSAGRRRWVEQRGDVDEGERTHVRLLAARADPRRR